MHAISTNLDQQFHALRPALPPSSPRVRERHTTAGVVRTIRCAFTVALAIAALTAVTAVTACGGGHRGDTYARATNALQQCCEHLAGAPRDSCLAAIVRVDDAKVAATTANQSTYGCVTEYFACDPTTGRATQTSAQAQLECIQDLP